MAKKTATPAEIQASPRQGRIRHKKLNSDQAAKLIAHLTKFQVPKTLKTSTSIAEHLSQKTELVITAKHIADRFKDMPSIPWDNYFTVDDKSPEAAQEREFRQDRELSQLRNKVNRMSAAMKNIATIVANSSSEGQAVIVEIRAELLSIHKEFDEVSKSMTSLLNGIVELRAAVVALADSAQGRIPDHTLNKLVSKLRVSQDDAPLQVTSESDDLLESKPAVSVVSE